MGSAATPDRDAIVGETPNVAARLQDHAEPGTLIISHDTYELVRGWFLVAPLGPIELRGIEGAMRGYQVVGEASEDARVHAQADLSPFVGRTEELATLTHAWTEVSAGGSGVLAVSGQPGVGKSRLVDVVRRRAEADEATVLAAGCSSYHGADALYPVRRLLERAAGIDSHQDPDLALPRLWTALEAVGQVEALSLIADLLDLPPTPWCPAPELEGVKLREQLLTTLVGWVRASAARGPMLLVIDDLQWADPTTIELLGRVVHSQIPGLLILLTIRDDAKVPWSAATVVTLDRLSGDELSVLARRLPEGRALSPDHLERVIQRSDGIPLFLEQLLRTSALAAGDEEAHASTIPAALRDLLLARFAAPGVDLRLAQVLATIGTEAHLPLIAAVSELLPSVLDQQLAALVDAGILTILPGDPLTYQFHHHLLSELAYDTQLQAARRQVHSDVADALVAGHDTSASTGPGVLAHHLKRAGRAGEAVAALTQAAEAAHGVGAHAEVIDLIDQAFTLLETVDADQRNALEFEVRMVRGIHESSTMGYAAPQAVEDFRACLDLIADVVTDGYLDDEGTDQRSREELVWSASGLWATFMLQGKLDAADELNRSMAARLRPDGELHPFFVSVRSFVDMFEGDYPVAIPGLARSVTTMAGFDRSIRRSVPGDPAVAALAHLSFALGTTARFDEARARSDDAIAMARDMPYPSGPFSVCYASSVRAGTEISAGDIAAARVFANEVAELAERHGFTFWAVIAGYYVALLDLHDGVDGAADRARGMIGVLRSINVLVWLPSFIAGVSAVLIRRGDVAVAEELLEDAAQVADATGARFYSAEIARQQGEARIALDLPGGVDLLRAATELAVDQGATLFELWARASLCRHTGDADDLAALAALVDSLGPGAEAVAKDIAAAKALTGQPI